MHKVRGLLLSIRGQLLLVSLLLLLIPVLGFRFVTNMQMFLRDGQQQVLVSTAQLLSATLSDRPLLMNRDLLSQQSDDIDRRRLVALFGSSDPETASNLGSAYMPSEEIEKILRVVAQNASRIWVVDSQLNVRGLFGNLSADSGHGVHGKVIPSAFSQLVRPLIFRYLVNDASPTIVESADSTERAVMSQVNRALNGEPSQLWRRAKDMPTILLSAAQPIWAGDDIVGAVVIEESTRSTQAITVAALETLLVTSFIVFLVGGVVLIAFAWRLTFRVERLRIDADRAIDSQGRITGLIADSQTQDEIGALARTLQDMLQRLARYNNYLEQMAARLAHELRTPIAVVRSSLDNLRHAEFAVQDRVYIDRADEGIRRLSILIARMSEASQLERMLEGSEKEWFDLVAVVAGCVEGYRTTYPAALFELQCPQNKIELHGLPDSIAQLLDKLIQNAVDFANPGSAIVVAVAADAANAVLAVKNRGAPIRPEILETLFASMVSMRDPAVSRRTHLGLGLYIVRLIAGFHDGSVSAENLSDGSGVRVELRLPLQRLHGANAKTS